MDDRFAVEVVKVGEDPRLEFILGCDPNVAKHGSSHLGEEALHKIEPGTMFRREHKIKAALWLGGKPRVGFFGNMCGVVVEDQLDRDVCRISGVEFLEKPDELPRAMAVFDAGMGDSSGPCVA